MRKNRVRTWCFLLEIHRRYTGSYKAVRESFATGSGAQNRHVQLAGVLT